MIKVLLVDHAAQRLMLIQQTLEALEDFQVVGTVKDRQSALDMTRRYRPQVICATLDSSDSALELTREVMREMPTPILLLSEEGITVPGATCQKVKEAGALEVVNRPNGDEDAMRSLTSRLRVLAGVKVFARRTPRSVERPELQSQAAARLVAIGASTGGPQAIGMLLRELSSVAVWPILCVQHMSAGFLDGMISWLSTQTELSVRIARHREVPQPGHVYFAPEDRHMRVLPDGSISVESGDAVDGHRPSATVLLSSVARAYGKAGVGVLLTGMGADGAQGLLEMSLAGALTLAQDEETSVVYGMARQALELGAVQKTTSLQEIGSSLLAIAKERRR